MSIREQVVLFHDFNQYKDHKGRVTEIGFLDRVESRQEIRAQWEARAVLGQPGLVGYFPLDEDSSRVAHDRFDPSRTPELRNSHQSRGCQNSRHIHLLTDGGRQSLRSGEARSAREELPRLIG